MENLFRRIDGALGDEVCMSFEQDVWVVRVFEQGLLLTAIFHSEDEAKEFAEIEQARMDQLTPCRAT